MIKQHLLDNNCMDSSVKPEEYHDYYDQKSSYEDLMYTAKLKETPSSSGLTRESRLFFSIERPFLVLNWCQYIWI